MFNSLITLIRSQKLLSTISLIIVVLVAAISWVLQTNITHKTQTEVKQSLEAVLNTTHQALVSWLKENKAAVKIWSNNDEVRIAAEQLLTISHSPADLLASDAQSRLRQWFRPLQQVTGYQGYFIIGPDQINLASSRDQNIGQKNLLFTQEAFFQKIWSGKTAVSLPKKSVVQLPDKNGVLQEGLPTMFVGAPIMNESGKVLAAFTFRINPADDFTSILQQGRIGKTGETYAFDKQGLLISNSRFNNQLRNINLIEKTGDATLNIQIKDPGASLILSEENTLPEDQRSLTLMASQAVIGQSGMNLDGYRDYRGVPVIGAWLWDSELSFGITTELDAAEAYQTLRATRYTIVTLTLLLILLFIGITVITLNNSARKRAQQALGESEDKYRTLFNAGSDLLIVLDQDTRQILDINEAAVQMYGYSREELLSMTESDISAELEETRKTVSLETPTTISLRYHKKKDGTVFPVEINQNPIVYQGRGLLVGVVRDITERLQAEEALHKAHDELEMRVQERTAELHEGNRSWQALLQATADSIFLIDMKSVCLEANEAAAKRFGTNRSGLKGKSLYDLMPPELVEKRRGYLKKVIETKKAQHFENMREEMYFDTKLYPVIDEEQKVEKVVAIASDITERKQAEKKLEESDTLWRSIMAAATESVFVLTTQGVVVSANEKAVKRFGQTTEDLLGTNVFDLMSTEVADVRRKFMDEVVQTKRAIQYEDSRDGMHFHSTHFPILDEKGNVDKVVIFAVDITERKQAEEELRKNEKQLRLITDNLPALITHMDSDLRYRFYNKAYRELHGLSPDELIGKHVGDLHGGEPYAKIKRSLDMALSGKMVTFETPVTDKDGEDHYYSATYVPDFVENGEVNGVYVLANDITERKQAEQELYNNHDLIQRVVKIQNHFLSSGESRTFFEQALQHVLEVTESEYGFIGEITYEPDGTPYLKTHAITPIAWNDETQKFYDENIEAGLEFRNLSTLFGYTIKNGEPLISNNPATDSHSGGLPDGHPPMNAYLGVPLHSGGEFVGMMGIANRVDGYNETMIEELAPLLGATANAIVVNRDHVAREHAEKWTQELLQQNRELTQSLFHVQEEERRHLARELHDEFGQWLTALRMHATALADRGNAIKLDTSDSIKTIDKISSRMHQAIRKMIHQLRPAELDVLGLKDSLQELVEQWQPHYPQTHCTLSMDDCLDNFNDPLGVTIYRIIQESLTNVAKYAEANNVSIQLGHHTAQLENSDYLLLTIEDDGKGINLDKPTKGIGIIGMRERVLIAGGEFVLQSSLGEGVYIEIQLPVTN